MIAFPDKPELTICVADFNIIIKKSANSLSLLLEEGYIEYLIDQDTVKADITITSFSSIPEHLLGESDLLYKAKKGNQDFWSIHSHPTGYKMIIQSQNNPGIVQQIALVDADFKKWSIYSEPVASGDTTGVCPLEYPMGPLLFYYLTINHDAIMIHASAVEDISGGRIFSGFSGVGKSTMAKIWERNGSKVINDDRLIIRKKGEDFYIYNTPMPYIDTPKSGKLYSVYFLYHAPTNDAQLLSPAKAASKLLAYSIIHGHNKKHLEHHLNFLGEIATKHLAIKLGVVPNDSIIDFIKKHESQHSTIKP